MYKQNRVQYNCIICLFVSNEQNNHLFVNRSQLKQLYTIYNAKTKQNKYSTIKVHSVLL